MNSLVCGLPSAIGRVCDLSFDHVGMCYDEVTAREVHAKHEKAAGVVFARCSRTPCLHWRAWWAGKDAHVAQG